MKNDDVDYQLLKTLSMLNNDEVETTKATCNYLKKKIDIRTSSIIYNQLYE